MASTWCLTHDAEAKLLDALQKEGDPQKMVDRGSEGRLAWFTKIVGEDNAREINAVFESKMLLKNQRQGFKTFIKNIGGRKVVQKDFLSKVDKLNKVLSNSEIDQFVNDYVSKKLGLEVTEEEYKKIVEISDKTIKLKKEWEDKIKENKDNLPEYLATHPKEKSMYGASRVVLENYKSELAGANESILGKLGDRAQQFKSTAETNVPKAVLDVGMDAIKTISDNSISLVATLDNSFIGRQGLFTLFTHPSQWFPAAANSFVDIAKTLGGKEAMDALMADVYSDPEYLDGSYQKAGILPKTEEQFPTSLPERIPVVGRVFKASETAFSGSAIRMRTGLYKMLSRRMSANGVNMKDSAEIQSLGKVINSLTARGQWGSRGEPGILRVVLWSPRMLKANIDVLTAHLGQDLTPAAQKEARINFLKIIGVLGLFMATAKALDPKSIELDPTSSDFGKFKFGKNHETRIDFTRGAASLVVLASRIAEGHYKTTNGQIVQYGSGYGQKSRFDALMDFLGNKAPPTTGAVIDYLKGKDINGKVPTPLGELYARNVPITIQNLMNLKDQASVSRVVGIITDFMGLNSNSYLDSNIKSGIIPENTKLSNEGMINQILLYAKALGTDPETAFNRIFTGQKITKVTNGTVMVERMSLGASQAAKKAGGGNNPQMKLDHTIPLELGGSNDASNLKLVTTGTWAGYTKVENALGKALKENRISKKDAQDLIVKFKKGLITKDYILGKY
jgi:hypothetical protein